VVIAVHDPLVMIVSRTPGVVFVAAVVVATRTLTGGLLDRAGGRVDWRNWPAFAQRSVRRGAWSVLRFLIFLLAYAVLFAKIAVPGALTMATLMVWAVYCCTATPLPGLVSGATTNFTARIADIVRCRDGRNSGSGVSGSCRCRDVTVTRGAMGSHDYPMGGGLSAYDVSSPRRGLVGRLHQQLDRGVLDKAIPRRGDWVSR
jgi:hypothetical protein